MRDITIGVTSRLAKIENSMVQAASAPNCATIVKSDSSSTPKPSASARLVATTGLASSFTVSRIASS